jgi:hypothetical protein
MIRYIEEEMKAKWFLFWILFKYFISLSYYCLCLLFNKIGKEGRRGSARKEVGQGREMAQTMYAHLNK